LDCQHEEGGLKRVISLVRAGEHGPANTQDHRTMSSQKRSESQVGGLVVLAPAGGKPIQLLGVAQARRRTVA